MTEWVVPQSWTQMSSWAQLERWRQKGGLIVILDDPTVSHYHLPTCEDVAERHFERKKASNWTTGAYFWIPRADAAAGYAIACSRCTPASL